MRAKKAVDKERKSTSTYVCSSPTCGKTFEKPKLVKCCPHCLSRIEQTTPSKTQLATMKEHLESPVESEPLKEEKRKEAATDNLNIWAPPKSAKDQEEFAPFAVVAVPESAEPQEKIDSTQAEDNQCKYYFGYLQNREKGEGIPETCVECPKSVDCMLSNLCQSQTAVSEIKKWYNIFE